jgi:hypothetical protein
MVSTSPELLCHPAERAVVRGFRGSCPVCGSFWDLEACERVAEYTDAYPHERNHFDPRVGALKVSTMERWLGSLDLDLRDQVVCEVGFGGGFCLAHLRQAARAVFGLEAVAANLAHAHSLGIHSSCLFLFAERPSLLPHRVSFWLFQDSFEHILELKAFMPWMVANSTDRAQLLIVAPNATSLSRRCLGRLWPHKLADHLFHWSPAGLISVCQRYGFRVKRRFDPTKHLSTGMVLNHLARTPLRSLAAILRKAIPAWEGWFNLGEMGFLFQRQ